jgi:SRSO17 transposase|tara:strand:+ start:1423 stop:1719 length:297 start_codon:yes stop_codon:yes gene_type:complete
MVYAEDSLPKGLKKTGVKKVMTTRKNIVKETTEEMEIYAIMLDSIDAGDCIEDFENKSTRVRITTLKNMLSHFYNEAKDEHDWNNSKAAEWIENHILP